MDFQIRIYIRRREFFFDCKPSTMPNSSLITLARGAKQFVVQEALLKRDYLN
jgi:hypothetical protein